MMGCRVALLLYLLAPQCLSVQRPDAPPQIPPGPVPLAVTPCEALTPSLALSVRGC